MKIKVIREGIILSQGLPKKQFRFLHKKERKEKQKSKIT